MALPSTVLTIGTVMINSLNLLEEMQSIDVDASNTMVQAKGIADRYSNKQATKQKQTLEFRGHWYDSSTSKQATTLDVTLWTLGGSAYLGSMKSGSLEVTNSGPEVSGFASLYEFQVPTDTVVVIQNGIMVVSEAVFQYGLMTGGVASFNTTVAITFAGEVITLANAIVTSSKHSMVRDGAQMENVTIESQGAITTTGDTTSLLYLSAIGAAITTFDVDTGVNEYKNQSTGLGSTALITKFGLTFRDKELVEQAISLEVQGNALVNAGS